MNLHICTISSRNEFLQKIYDSFPYHGGDIIWHIARSNNNPLNITDHIQENAREDKITIQVHELTCDDSDTPFKMNYIFEQIKITDPDSYFCILDDDTLFHFKMHVMYSDYKEKQFMVIGKQVDKNYVTRLQGTLPYECAIDSGNVLCHSNVLGKEKWPDQHWDETMHVDFEFWNKCFKHFGVTKTDIVPDIISIYNYFSDKPDTLDYAR